MTAKRAANVTIVDADLSRAEAVALVWTISPEVAERLLCAYFELRSGSIEGA